MSSNDRYIRYDDDDDDDLPAFNVSPARDATSNPPGESVFDHPRESTDADGVDTISPRPTGRKSIFAGIRDRIFPETVAHEREVRTMEQTGQTHSGVIFGPTYSGKTFLLLAIGRACSLPGKENYELKLVPEPLAVDHIPSDDEPVNRTSISELMERSVGVITGYEMASATSMTTDYSFEITAVGPSPNPVGKTPYISETLNLTLTDMPGGALFTDEADDNASGREIERWQTYLVSRARKAKSLILCVDAAEPHLILIHRNLPGLIEKFVLEQNIPVEHPEKRSLWDRVLGRPAPTQLVRQHLLNVDKFLILLNKVDILCHGYEVASRIDPVDLARQLLGVSVINQIQQALKPGAQLAIGVTSSLGFDPATGASLADSEAFIRREPDINILQRWEPFGVRDALAFLVLGRAFGSVKLVSPEQNQRSAEDERLLNTLAQELGRIDNLIKLARAEEIVSSQLDQLRYFHISRHIRDISALAQDFLTRNTLIGQLNVLKELKVKTLSFHNAIAQMPQPAGNSFRPIAQRWLEIVNAAEETRNKELAITPIENPFVFGHPLQPRDEALFRGRRDIIVAIEENIINPAQRLALLLYGRRRSGKSSTLLNLPRLVSGRFVPVYLDCQDAKWRDGDDGFCYHLAASIFKELFQRNLHGGLIQPRLEQFEKHPFTRLAEFLDGLETLSRRINKQILLTFDEYERMEEGLRQGKITVEVLNQLRHIIQHRQCIVVLVSGGHQFEELTTVDWSDYLINTKTLKLSYLLPEDAWGLVTRPVPDFKMSYEPGVAERLVDLTHGQPYLLQALAWELVNHLNRQNRLTATMNDLETAIEKVLVSAQSYFSNVWTEDCSDAERAVLHALASSEAVTPEQQHAVQRLCRKEIVVAADGDHSIVVPLFRRWIEKEQLMIRPAVQFAQNGRVSTQEAAPTLR